MKKWKKLSEKPFRAGFRKMVNKVFELPNGKQQDFDIKDEGAVACVVAFTENNTILLTRQFRPGPEKIFLELPAGYIDKGEKPLETAQRELLEETGYAGQLEFVGTAYKCGYSNLIQHCFVARDCKKVQEQQLDENEFIEVIEYSLAKFRELIKSGEMSDIGASYICLDYLGLLQ